MPAERAQVENLLRSDAGAPMPAKILRVPAHTFDSGRSQLPLPLPLRARSCLSQSNRDDS